MQLHDAPPLFIPSNSQANLSSSVVPYRGVYVK